MKYKPKGEEFESLAGVNIIPVIDLRRRLNMESKKTDKHSRDWILILTLE